MRVAELMQADVTTISPDDRIEIVVRTMADSSISGLPVVDSSGRILGVVSATDVLQATAEKDDAEARARFFENATAREIMTPVAQTIEPDADIHHAAQKMLYSEVRRLFVTEQGKLVGVISQTDIAYAMGTGRL